MAVTTNAGTALREREAHVIPVPGTYLIDPSHTTAEFVSRHLMISKVRGRFADVAGDLHIAERPEESSVEAAVQVASLASGDEKRDAHLLSPDFLDAEKYSTITFRSTKVEPGDDGRWTVVGDLTVRGVTKPVVLDVEFDGATTDPWGGQRIGLTATTEVDREEWGLTWNVALEGGGVLVGRKVRLELNVQATLVQ